jgi:hypothetical protein
MDAQWMNQLSEEDWKNGIIEFQSKLTDSVIEAAVKKIPPEVYAISGKKMEEKLKNRRNALLEYAIKYYRFLALNAYVIGSEQKEFFMVDKDNDNVTVTVSRDGSKDKSQVIYQRTFNQNDTKKIHIMGLDGNDHFKVDEKVSSSIKLYLQGGKGNDIYSVKGKIKATIEDDNYSKNKSVLAINNQQE